MKLFVGTRLQQFAKTGSMGVVTDALYHRCYWPMLDRPTALFADGSKGIVVRASTPRNVIFPPDTIFADFHPDALYPAEQALFAAFKGIRAIINLTDEQAGVYISAYDEAVKSFPKTHAIHSTRGDCHFLRHREVTRTYQVAVMRSDGKPVMLDGKPLLVTKQDEDHYIAELSPDEVANLMSGKIAEADLRAAKTFCHIEDDPNAPDARKMSVTSEPLAQAIGG